MPTVVYQDTLGTKNTTDIFVRSHSPLRSTSYWVRRAAFFSLPQTPLIESFSQSAGVGVPSACRRDKKTSPFRFKRQDPHEETMLCQDRLGTNDALPRQARDKHPPFKARLRQEKEGSSSRFVSVPARSASWRGRGRVDTSPAAPCGSSLAPCSCWGDSR